jgi:AhpC/TSA family protein
MVLRTKDSVSVGSKAPNFALPSQSGEMVNLKDFLGKKPVVMVFQQYKEQLPCATLPHPANRGQHPAHKTDDSLGETGRPALLIQ